MTGLMIYAAVVVPAVLVALAVAVWRLWHRQRQVDDLVAAMADCVEAMVALVAMRTFTDLSKEGVRDGEDR